MLASSIPVKFDIPFASAADPSNVGQVPETPSGVVGTAAMTTGFPSENFLVPAQGGVPPFGKDFNGLFLQITKWLQWAASAGPVNYDATFSASIGGYPAGALLKVAGIGQGWWLSLVDNNVTNPDASGAGWQLIASGAVSLISAPVTLTISDSTKNFVVTANATITLPVASATNNGVCYGFVCRGGVATIIPDGAAGIAGGAVGQNYAFPNGTGGLLARDSSGNWSILYFSSAGTGIYTTGPLVMLPGQTYLIDSRAGAFNLTVPAASGAASAIAIQDVGQALNTFPVALVRTGADTIMGLAETCALNMPGIGFTMTNDGITTDWRFS